MSGATRTLPGKNLRDSGLREDRGRIVVAIKRSGESTMFNPGPETVIQADDTLIVIRETLAESQ